MASQLGACAPRAAHFYLHKHKHPLILPLESLKMAPFGRAKITGRESLRIRVSDGGDSYLGMWKKAVENDKKVAEFERIVENSAKIDVDDQSVEPVEELEKKSEEFQKILEVSKEERDRVQRMQVVDRAAAAIAAARAILEDKNKELRTEAGDRGGSGGGSGGGGDGTIGARQEGAQIRSVVVPVPQSEISGTWTPGPDFWSWEPPQGSDKVSDDVIDLPTAMKTSAQLNVSNPVLEKERSVDYLSIPLESKLQEPNRNPPLPPLQSLMEVEKVDVSGALSPKEEHELGDEFSAHAAEAAQALDAVDEVSSYGVNTDGSKWWKESGIEQRPDGVICKWTMTRGVSADQVTEWQDKYWEAADEFGHKELGSEKLGRNATGNVWREFWTESMWQNCGLVHMEKTADKWGKNGRGDEWHEKWKEHYDASGQAEKWAHKWCSIDPNTPLEAGHAHIWHERWGEQYDGHGGSEKYTDKWAERCEGDGWAKWGDKWDEHFDPNGHGVKQGETWWEGKFGERWNRTWGEGHNGSGWVHKYGKSSSGEHWDTHEQQDTWYERFPHFGFYHCFENSVKLREVPKPSEMS
ncbi:uncharacterized protein LOC103964754 [Pyrus x bretschneideri]|uniref:uncharacterized protein LOC103964754 n=1 Tax=Pyrus x bretschneideri TaxID=225117 RepID=UPI0020303D9C|nr:uncharacterized protein LOC103964754 [Pyrus x bretschneideri]